MSTETRAPSGTRVSVTHTRIYHVLLILHDQYIQLEIYNVRQNLNQKLKLFENLVFSSNLRNSITSNI